MPVPLNSLLGALGLESWKRAWMGDPTWALWTILVVLVWQFVGLSMVMYLAGLQGIPEELDEASAVDGASTIRRFRKVTLPLLAPAITVSVTLSADLRPAACSTRSSRSRAAAPSTRRRRWRRRSTSRRSPSAGSATAPRSSLVLTVLITVLAVAQLVVLRARERRL